MRRAEGRWGDAPFAGGLDGRGAWSGLTFGQVDISMTFLTGHGSSERARVTTPARDSSAACDADHALVHITIEMFRGCCRWLHNCNHRTVPVRPPPASIRKAIFPLSCFLASRPYGCLLCGCVIIVSATAKSRLSVAVVKMYEKGSIRSRFRRGGGPW
jgi:hypothetical protein